MVSLFDHYFFTTLASCRRIPFTRFRPQGGGGKLLFATGREVTATSADHGEDGAADAIEAMLRCNVLFETAWKVVFSWTSSITADEAKVWSRTARIVKPRSPVRNEAAVQRARC